MAEARKWLHQIELQKAEAKEKKVICKNEGIRLVDVADEFLELKRGQAKKGKIKDSYVEQLRIQTDHFKRFFNGERTTFVKTIQTAQIEAYFEYEETEEKKQGGLSAKEYKKKMEREKEELKKVGGHGKGIQRIGRQI